MVLTPSYIPSDGPNMLLVYLARVHRRLSAIYLIMARMLLPQGKRFGICILFTHPTATLDSLLYLSEETFIPAIARTIRITPTGIVVGKIRRFADTAFPSGLFDTRHEHEFVQTAKKHLVRFERERARRRRLDDNKRKRADGGRWRRAKVTLL